MTPFAEFKKTLLADPAVRAEYDALEDEFALIAQWSEVAERMGTKQAAVARLEGGRVHLSLATLRRYAQATGARLVVRLDR